MREAHGAGTWELLAAGNTPISCSRGRNWNSVTMALNQMLKLSIRILSTNYQRTTSIKHVSYIPVWFLFQTLLTPLQHSQNLMQMEHNGMESTSSMTHIPVKANQVVTSCIICTPDDKLLNVWKSKGRWDSSVNIVIRLNDRRTVVQVLAEAHLFLRLQIHNDIHTISHQFHEHLSDYDEIIWLLSAT